jgi:preprotein translocase subunit SecE
MATTTKKKFTERVANWFRGMKSELKKVVWPSRKQVVNNSLVVLAMVVVSGIGLWVFDYVASSLVHVLISLFG